MSGSWVTLSARLKVVLFTQHVEVRRYEVATYPVLGCRFFRIIPFMEVKKIALKKISPFTSWLKGEIRQVSLKIKLQVRTVFCFSLSSSRENVFKHCS